MTRNVALLVVLLMCMMQLQTLADDTIPKLKNNPFDQPSLVDQNQVLKGGAVLPAWSGALQATLVSGVGSLANIDGTVVAIGEEFRGYQLVRVEEGVATLTKDGDRIVITIGDAGAENDD